VKNLAMALVLAGLVVGALYWTTVSHVGVECELCMRFEGRERCATAAAATRIEAEQAASMTACGVLANGVTAAFKCQATVPRSVRCTNP
jgi:hypothetical protein